MEAISIMLTALSKLAVEMWKTSFYYIISHITLNCLEKLLTFVDCGLLRFLAENLFGSKWKLYEIKNGESWLGVSWLEVFFPITFIFT